MQLALAERAADEIIGTAENSLGTAEKLGFKDDFLDIRIEIKRREGGASRSRRTAVGH